MTFQELMMGARAHPFFEARELYKTKVGLKRATQHFLELVHDAGGRLPSPQLNASLCEVLLWTTRCSSLLSIPSGTLEGHCLTCKPNRNVWRALVVARELGDQVAKFVILSEENREPNRARHLSLAVFGKTIRVLESFGLALEDLQIPEQASA